MGWSTRPTGGPPINAVVAVPNQMPTGGEPDQHRWLATVAFEIPEAEVEAAFADSQPLRLDPDRVRGTIVVCAKCNGRFEDVRGVACPS